MLIVYVIVIRGIIHLVYSTRVRQILDSILEPVKTRTIKLVFANIRRKEHILRSFISVDYFRELADHPRGTPGIELRQIYPTPS
jgi:hypothetical protein